MTAKRFDHGTTTESIMESESRIAAAAELLNAGKLVAFPTETVYGLGANALDANAVAKIFELKGRPRFDPLIVHIADAEKLNELVDSVPPMAQTLMNAFWPGPLTFVLNKLPHVPDIVTAGLPSVAVRCPKNPIAQKLIRAADLPVAAPSANRFGMVSPTTADHVKEQFASQLSMILDDGPCEVGVESTVISFASEDHDRPKLLRPGGITLEDIEAITGPLSVNLHEENKPTSPGQLSRHYSPSTPFMIVDDLSDFESMEGKRVGLLTLQPSSCASQFDALEVLSETGDLSEAATRLFAAMRRLDALSLDMIVAQPVPEVGLGRAIMDRIRRAASR
jgi:L-threonylcarbamoyladenylate synthase